MEAADNNNDNTTIVDNNNDDTMITRTEIARNGDVVLVVGSNKKEILVSSFILKNASPYFTALFGPHFAEGQDLDSNNPKEISMPEDDAEALEIICNVVHLRNDAIPQSLRPQDILEVAVAANKFELDVALQYASKLWLSPKDITDISELAYLMAAAYIFNDAQAFSEITLKMIYHHADSLFQLADQIDDLTEWLPRQVLYQLEERRNRLRTELQQILFFGSMDAYTVENYGCKCAWGACHALRYIELLRMNALLPLQTLTCTISEVIQRMDKMIDPVYPVEFATCSDALHEEPGFRAERDERLRKFRGKHGLCIDCVASETQDAYKVHRIENCVPQKRDDYEYD